MSLELIIGPMFSGKTTHLIGRIERHSIAGRSCVIMRHQIDTRTEDIVTHSGIKFEGNIMVYSNRNRKILKELVDYDVVGIDEGHFFQDIGEIVSYLLIMKRIVVVSTLNSSYNRLPFEHLKMLYVEADKIIKLSAVCYKCKKDAIFTKRKEGFVGDVGGKEMYDACCRSCWNIE